MRKQLIVIISVALASFLIGTMFSTNYLASGARPPSIWDAINQLQSQVNALNATVIEQQTEISELQSKIDSVRNWRMIRLQHNQTYYVEAGKSSIIVNITWTPTSESFNFLIRAINFVEVRGAREGQFDVCYWQVTIHGENKWEHTRSASGYDENPFPEQDNQWRWGIAYDGLSNRFDYRPFDIAYYTFTFELWASTGSAYIRNLNVVIEVVDGLAQS